MLVNIVQLMVWSLVAFVCAAIAHILIPRPIPGKFVGLAVIGCLGVWLGEWAAQLMSQGFNVHIQVLDWEFAGILIVPGIIGCVVLLYLITVFLEWGRFYR